MDSHKQSVEQLEKKATDIQSRVDYIMEKTNRLGGNQDKEQGGMSLVNAQESGYSVKGFPLKDNLEINNGRSKAPDNPNGINLGTRHRQVC